MDYPLENLFGCCCFFLSVSIRHHILWEIGHSWELQKVKEKIAKEKDKTPQGLRQQLGTIEDPHNKRIIDLDLRSYKNIFVDYVVYHVLRYRTEKIVLDHIDRFFLNRPVLGQMAQHETFSTWSGETQCWDIKFDDLGILLGSSAIDHLLDWDNHLLLWS